MSEPAFFYVQRLFLHWGFLDILPAWPEQTFLGNGERIRQSFFLDGFFLLQEEPGRNAHDNLRACDNGLAIILELFMTTTGGELGHKYC